MATTGPSNGWHWREWGSECAGTALLLFCVVTAKDWIVRAGAPVSEIWIRVALVGAVAGLVVIAVAYSPLGRRSGAHLNPVVTLGLAVQGSVGAADLVAYPVAQVAGGIAGVVAAGAWGLTVAAAAVRWAVIAPAGAGLIKEPQPVPDSSESPSRCRTHQRTELKGALMSSDTEFWPGGARLAVTVSMQFEAGGQPISGAGGPITEPVLPGFPDLGQNSFYEYGAREGVRRLLDLFDRHDIKMTSFMIGDAVRRHPDVAAEIVNRGHEAGAHGRRWERQYQLPRPQEAEWIADSVEAIEKVTGFRPLGYNNYWIRPGVNTLEVLQEQGFTYHIDDLSADEPFLQTINGAPFATVPYSVHLNDIASFDFPGFSPADYEQQLIDEFDQLYEEGAQRRRLMVIALHERISGHASRVRVLDRIFTRFRDRSGVWWARKDQIAQYALDHPESMAWVDRDPAPVSGLPGRSA